MGISTHWGGADDSGTIINWGVYCLLTERSIIIHYNYSYHGLVSGGGAEAGYADLAEMVRAGHSIYTRDKSGARGIVYGGVDGDVGFRRIERLGYGRVEEGQMSRITREYQADNWRRSNKCST